MNRQMARQQVARKFHFSFQFGWVNKTHVKKREYIGNISYISQILKSFIPTDVKHKHTHKTPAIS
jgi:hypothetical protein